MSRRTVIVSSMFHRRLLLLFGVAVVITLGLGVQLSRLAVVQGAERLTVAQKRLNLLRYLPTSRGRILDRHGRVLAADRSSFDVAVHYEVITGSWALRRAAAQAKSANRSEWAAMSPQQREAAIEASLPQFQSHIEEVWAAVRGLGGIDQAELDRRLDAIKREVQSTAAAVWDRKLRRDIKAGRGTDDETGLRPFPILEQRQPHVVLSKVPKRVAFEFRRISELEQLQGTIVVQDSHRRAYPWSTAEVTLDRSTMPRALRSSEPLTVQVEGVADHILGSVRDQVYEQDRKRRPFRDAASGRVDLGGYKVGDVVGARGLERVFEDHLRGLRGAIRTRRDTGREQRQPRVAGSDLQTTLDIALQARIQALLSPELGLTLVQQWQAGWNGDGSPRPTALPRATRLNSAAVVLDVATGEILAMVSMPTVAMGSQMNDQQRARDWPFLNRPVEAVYPPGSIIKPLVLSAAVSEGVHRLDDPIECTGHYFPELKNAARCWIYRAPAYATHGSLVVEEAIARSCNIYFYTLADRLGMVRLASWYRRFGLAEPIDVGLLYQAEAEDGALMWRGESAGDLPGEEDVARLRAVGELAFASVIFGSGQGPVTWTPIQAANAYATFARGGVMRDATLIKGSPRRERTSRDSDERESREDLDLDERFVARVLEGLRESVEAQHGTGHHIRYADGSIDPIINARGVSVWAKTGTAQAPPWRFRDTNNDGKIDTNDDGIDHLSHAWFVGLVGPKSAATAEPRYAIAVVVEYGGSGGRTAGPIANQIIHALQAEGYLPGGEP